MGSLSRQVIPSLLDDLLSPPKALRRYCRMSSPLASRRRRASVPGLLPFSISLARPLLDAKKRLESLQNIGRDENRKACQTQDPLDNQRDDCANPGHESQKEA